MSCVFLVPTQYPGHLTAACVSRRETAALLWEALRFAFPAALGGHLAMSLLSRVSAALGLLGMISVKQ